MFLEKPYSEYSENNYSFLVSLTKYNSLVIISNVLQELIS